MVTSSALSDQALRAQVGAVFADEADVHKAVEQLISRIGVSARQIRIVEPGDPAAVRQQEPKGSGIAGMLLQSKSILGVAGLLFGVVISLLLILLAGDPFTGNPYYTLLIVGLSGTIGGLLLGGLASLRPDRDWLATWIEGASNERWLLLIEVRNLEQDLRVKDVLERVSDKVVGVL